MESSQVISLVENFSRKRSSESVSIGSLELKSFNEKKTMPPVWRMVLNGKPLKRENPYRISYRCPKCEVLINLNYEVFATKMNKGLPWLTTLQCKSCYDNMKAELELGKAFGCLADRVSASIEAFNIIDSSFKWRYYLHYPTEMEFGQFLPRISNLSDIIKKNGLNYSTDIEMVYCPTIQVPNARCFEPRLWFKGSKELMIPVPSFNVKCDWCTNEFMVATLHQVKLYGPGPVICHLCKKIAMAPPRIESTVNAIAKGDGLGLGLVAKKERKGVDGKVDLEKVIVKPGGEVGIGTPEKVEHRSHTGLKFVRGCIKRGLVAEKGPMIGYQRTSRIGCSDEEGSYQVAFCIPSLGLLVLEIDSQEQWSVEKENGIWGDVINGIEEYVMKSSNYQRYLVIHSKNKAEVFQEIDKLLNA